VKALPPLFVCRTALLRTALASTAAAIAVHGVHPAPVAAAPEDSGRRSAYSAEASADWDLIAQSDADATDSDVVEDAQPDATSERRVLTFSNMLETITVTARKRPELADQIPISISVLSRDDLQQQLVRRTQDIVSPNLEIDNSFGFGNAARATLRGVGQFDVAATIDPGVGTYLDGVYLARPQSGLLSLTDLERVEILRGPQGTVFGKNTIGGALNIVTAKPEFQFGGDAEVRYGDFDEVATRFSLNVPLIPEQAALRLSLATATRDGYLDNVSSGSDGDDEKLLAGRAQLRLLPTADLEILLAGDLSRENKETQSGACIPTSNIGGVGTLLGQVDLVNSALSAAGILPGPVPPQSLSASFAAACADSAGLEDRRRFRSDLSFSKDELTSFGGSGTINWDLGSDTMFTSISAARGLRLRARSDADATAFPLFAPDDAGRFKQDQISQEFRLTSSLLDGRLRYLVGAYGFRETIDNSIFARELGVSAPTLVGLTAAGPQFAQLPFGTVMSEFKSGSLSYAAFGQLSFSISSALEFTAGLRYTQERKRFLRNSTVTSSGIVISALDPAVAASALTTGNILPLVTPQAAGTQFGFFDSSERFSDFTPSASLTYRFDEDTLAYLSFSTGFKSGGFDGRDAMGAPEVDPEDLTTYEVGFKSSLLDGRVRLNAAAFYSVYKDIQLTVATPDPTDPSAVLNAGKALIRGGEVELSLLPIENLLLTSSIGVLKTRYDSFDDFDLSTGVPVPVNRDNLDLPFAPNYTMRFAATYSVPLSIATVTVRADWMHKGAQALDVFNTEQLRQGKFGELGARVGIASNDGLTELAFYGRNLLDRDHFVSGIDQTGASGFVLRFLAPPRTYGVELRRRF